MRVQRPQGRVIVAARTREVFLDDDGVELVEGRSGGDDDADVLL